MRTSPPPDRVTDAQLSVDHATIVTEDAPVPKFHQARTITVMPSVVVVCTAMITLGSGRADLSHSLGMRGRSPCVR